MSAASPLWVLRDQLTKEDAARLRKVGGTVQGGIYESCLKLELAEMRKASSSSDRSDSRKP